MWLWRWPVREWCRVGSEVRDVRVWLCAEYLALWLEWGFFLVEEGWAYG